MIEILHKTAEMRLTQLADCTLKWLKRTSADLKKIHFHVMLSWYTADIPECENMFSVKRSTKISAACHSFLVGVAKCSSNQFQKTRTLSHTKLLNDMERRGSTLAEQNLHEL